MDYAHGIPGAAIVTRMLHSFPGGLKLATLKTISSQEKAIQQPLPDRLVLPLQQHIGLAAEPVVKTGDRVLKGQVIARASGYVSVPVHASTSGRIADIGNYPVPHLSRITAPCIVIESDGRDEWFAIRPVREYDSVDPKDLQAAIRECGIIGLGGAGFPAHVKLNEGVENAVDTLIINGVECEPYITCDDRLIQEKADYVVSGTRMIRHAVQAKHCVIAVEDDMPAAYQALEKLIDDDIELIRVPARYPAGGEKQLIQVITGMEVPSGGLPIHIGIVMHNVATAAAVYRAVSRGEPIVSRYVTITGEVEKPRNLQVLLGTPVQDCVEKCGHVDFDDCRIILGGPMMGMHVENPDIPIIKTTNCILITGKKPVPVAMPCIRCGKCTEVCPVRLLPQQLYRYAGADDFGALHSHKLFDCIECGLCAYVCPSHIPLVQYYRKAKARIAEEERRQTGADLARARFLGRNQRIVTADRNTSRVVETGNMQEQGQDMDEKKDYIRAAVNRTRKKRKQ